MTENFAKGAGSAGAGEPRPGSLPYPRRINDWTPQVFDRARAETRRAGVTINSLNAYLVADVIISDALVGENIMDPRFAEDRAYAIGEIRKFFRLNFVLPSEVSATEAVAYLRTHQDRAQQSLTRTQRDAFPTLLRDLERIATNPNEIEEQLVEVQRIFNPTFVDTTPRRDLTTEELFNSVSEAATGSVIIRTDLPEDMEVAFKLGKGKVNGGDSTFGDGSFGNISETTTHFAHVRRITTMDGSHIFPPDLVEAVAFIPTTRDAVAHGTEESAINFEYAFDPKLQREGERVTYGGTSTPRSGNFLWIRVTLPQSIADILRDKIEENPAIRRVLIEKLMLERGGITEAFWPRAQPPFTSSCYLLTPSAVGDPQSSPLVARKLVGNKN